MFFQFVDQSLLLETSSSMSDSGIWIRRRRRTRFMFMLRTQLLFRGSRSIPSRQQRAIWGWDDSYLYIGNMKRAIHVISASNKSMMSLESPDITSIPCRWCSFEELGHAM